MAEKILHSRQPGGCNGSTGGGSALAGNCMDFKTEPPTGFFSSENLLAVSNDSRYRDLEANCLTNANNLPEGLLIVASNGLNCFANLRVTELTGYRTDELLKMRLSDLAHPDDLSIIEAHASRERGAKTHPRHYRVNFIHKNGGVVPIEIKETRTSWFGRSACMILLRDIRAAKRREKRLQMQIDELRSALKRQTWLLDTCMEKLKTGQIEIQRYRVRLENVTKELLEANSALSALARNIDQKKEAVEKKTNLQVTAQILPIVEMLKQDGKLIRFMPQLSLLEAYIRGLTSSASEHQQTLSKLTEREMHIAALVRNGFSSLKIASLLHISYETVKTHRKNIRKKVGVQDKDLNLNTFLKTLLAGE